MSRRIELAYAPSLGEAGLLNLYLPDGEEACPLYLYLHGGGLESGSKDGDEGMATRLAGSGIAVATMNYRLYPHARFPEFVEDCAAAAAYLKEHGGEYRRFSRFTIGGSSAGGYLSMMLCFDRHYLLQHGIDPDGVDAYLFDAGQPTTHFNVLRERGLDSRLVRVDEAAPLFFVDGDVDPNRKPPMLFIVSDHDMENRLEQTALMRRTLLHFGYAPERVRLQVMTGFAHCGYLNDDRYYDLVVPFLKGEEAAGQP